MTMSDEDAFIRAIQSTPDDATTKLVYADWLDERGQTARAAYLRRWAELGDKHGRPVPDNENEEVHPHRAWCDLIHGSVVLWDTPSLLALGRLEGLFRAYSAVNDHSSNIQYSFN